MRNFSVKFSGTASDIPTVVSTALDAEILAEYGANGHSTNIQVFSRQHSNWCRIIGLATVGQTLSEDFSNSTATSVQARAITLTS